MLELLMNTAKPNTLGLPDDYSISLLGPDLSSYPKRDKGQIQESLARLSVVGCQSLGLRLGALCGVQPGDGEIRYGGLSHIPHIGAVCLAVVRQFGGGISDGLSQ